MSTFKLILEIGMAICWSVVIVSVIMWIRISLIANKLANLPLEALPIRKTNYVQMVVDWCHDNISYSNTQKPNVKINYYQHQKISGLYTAGYHECIIYVNSHRTIGEVTNTVIHEYVHARQRDKNFIKKYEKYHREIGYERNPYEVEARRVARKYEKDCLLWVCQQLAEKTA
jgi:hypothetical protein